MLAHILNQQHSSHMRERAHVMKNKKQHIDLHLELIGEGEGGILKLLSQSIKGKQKCQDYVKNNKGKGRAQHETTQHATRES